MPQYIAVLCCVVLCCATHTTKLTKTHAKHSGMSPLHVSRSLTNINVNPVARLHTKVSSEFYVREVMGIERSPWGVLAWDVAGMGICYMCLEAVAYLAVVLTVEYSLAAGVRSKLDRWRLWMGGWTTQDLDNMLAQSRGQEEDIDVRTERMRVDGAGMGWAERRDAGTILIQGLSKVSLREDCASFLHL